MHRTGTPGAAAVAGLVLAAVAGCGSGGGGGAPAAETASAHLSRVPTGTADISYDAGTQTLTVTMHVSGAAPKVALPSHIHKGSCAGPPGDVLYPLKAGVADAGGVVNVTSTVSNVPAVPSGAYVHFHTGPTTATAGEKKSIVCGDLTGDPGTIRLGPNGAPGDNPTGTATITRDPSTRRMTVKVVVDGLEPNTSHPSHIHLGSCEAQGPVIVPLNALQADSSGHAEATTTVQNAPDIGSWYVNVHRGPGLAGPEFTPVTCGNVASS
ncbi:MAG TPA: CHRD domain-containing protein [Candidatus Dormibacteraeota bacterium]